MENVINIKTGLDTLLSNNREKMDADYVILYFLFNGCLLIKSRYTISDS